jgi:8-oxo-dGTP diphosphatase
LDRLAAALRTDPAALAGALGADGAEPRVIVVLEGKARDAAPPGPVDDLALRVVHAPGVGDDTIVEVVRGTEPPVRVVTADRGLAERVQAAGAELAGPSALLRALDRITS